MSRQTLVLGYVMAAGMVPHNIAYAIEPHEIVTEANPMAGASIKEKITTLIVHGDLREKNFVEMVLGASFFEQTPIQFEDNIVTYYNLEIAKTGVITYSVTYPQGKQYKLLTPTKAYLHVWGGDVPESCLKIEEFRPLFDTERRRVIPGALVQYEFTKYTSQKLKMSLDMVGVFMAGAECAKYIDISEEIVK